MPTTHISTWAKENGVDITQSYMREDREGGIDALGTGFPGIRREDLMVLPEADWQRMKDQLTYEDGRQRPRRRRRLWRRSDCAVQHADSY